MTIEALRKAHSAEPFSRFALVLADGTRIPVNHPENLAHAGAGRSVVVFEGPEEYRVIDLPLVEALEFGKSGRNGRAKRGRNGHAG